MHHIIVRGIDRQKIFENDEDRDYFLSRLGIILTETKTDCYAWALIPNHFHLLLRTCNVSISTTMRRLLTGYARWYNRRHRRYGHLFQNRYKSILCRRMLTFVGTGAVHPSQSAKRRILGNGDFVESVFKAANEHMERKYDLRARGFSLTDIAARVAEVLGVEQEKVWDAGRQREIVQARSLFCYWAVRELGVTMISLSRQLNLSVTAIGKAVIRGEKLAKANKHLLFDK